MRTAYDSTGYTTGNKGNIFLRFLSRNDPDCGLSRFGIGVRKRIYPVIRRLSGPLTDVKGVLVKAEPLPKGPKIFAVTHTYAREDIAWGLTFAGEQSYLITNAYLELLHSSDGWALWASGVILVNRYSKESRKASLLKAENALKMGANVMIFPEGVWNMSENQIVRGLFPGVYKLAHTSQVPVIPMATMIYNGICYVSRGEPLRLDQHEKSAGITLLRDTMATMKWELMERYGVSTRNELLDGKTPEDYWHDHVENYIATQGIYEREAEATAHYQSPQDREQAAVKAHLDQLIPCPENAFLFRSRD